MMVGQASSPRVGAARFWLRQRFFINLTKITYAGKNGPRKPASLEVQGQPGGLSYVIWKTGPPPASGWEYNRSHGHQDLDEGRTVSGIATGTARRLRAH